MDIKTLKIFDKQFRVLPLEIKKRAKKQFGLLLENFRHPSLGVKKVKREQDVWEARVTRGYRFTFQIRGSYYLLRRIGEHDKVLKNP